MQGLTRGLVFTAVITFSLVACQPQQRTPQPEERSRQAGFINHSVQYPGETLSIIAAWYTGSSRNWELLLDANPGLDPRRIRLGDTIRIPRELASRTDPLPKSAVSGGRSSPERVAPRATAPAGSSTTTSESVSESGSMSEDSAASFDDRDMAEAPTEPAGEVVDESTGYSWDEPVSDEPMEEPAVEVVPTEAPAAVSPPSEGLRIKSRDELLRELLEE